MAKLKRRETLGKKKKFQVFFLPSPPFSFYFRENFPPRERRTRKLNRFEDVPFRGKSLFDNAGHVDGEHSLDVAFLRNFQGGVVFLTSPHSFSFRMLEYYSPRNKVYFLRFSLSLFYLLSNYKSVKMLSQRRKKHFSHLCLTQMLQPFGRRPIF